MAQITKVGSKGHHTFVLEVTEGSHRVYEDGKKCDKTLNYKFTMTGGSWDFHWNSRKISWAINIGGNVIASGEFGDYYANTTLTIANSSVTVNHDYAKNNEQESYYFDFRVTDGIKQRYSTGDIDWGNGQYITTSAVTLYEKTDPPSFKIEDNGDNTFKFTGNLAADKFNNKVTGAIVYYKYGNSSNVSVPTVLSFNDNITHTGTAGQKFDLKPIFNNEKKDIYIKAIACTKSLHGNSRTAEAQQHPIQCKYYSAVGNPTISKPLMQQSTTDNSKYIVTTSAIIGSDGNNNKATKVQFKYKIRNDGQEFSLDGVRDTTNPKKYSCTFTINGTDAFETIYVSARTVGTVNKEVFINNVTKSNIYYSQWEDNIYNAQFTKPSQPSNPPQIIDNGNNSFKITAYAGNPGDNNAVIGAEIYYTTDGTNPDPQNNIGTLYDGGDIFIEETENKETKIKAVARTVGSAASLAYKYSDFTGVSSTTIKYYKVPNIGKATITTADNKKLTKKSPIIISSNINLYKNTIFDSYNVYLYKIGQQEPLQRGVNIIKFQYVDTQSTSYPCIYSPGTTSTYTNTNAPNTRFNFEILEDGGIRAYGKIHQAISGVDSYAKYYFNNSGALGTEMIPGETYTIKDCMVCYHKNERNSNGQITNYYYVSNNNITWEKDYTVVAAYIQIVNNTDNVKVIDENDAILFYPQILHSRTKNIVKIDQDKRIITQDILQPVTYDINLKEYDIKKGDEIYAKIEYNIFNAANNNLAQEDVSQSDQYPVLSSGIMRVYVGDGWHEGQVFVNVDGSWKEATDVFINIDGQWNSSV